MRQRLRLRPGTLTPRLLGIEHEFRVSTAKGAVDFRSLIHGLRLGQPNLDPADPNAYRLPSGAAVTCDGAEAEIALPPVAVRAGFTRELRLRAQLERLALADRLPAGHAIEGCSTHVSVSVPDGIAQAVCRLYATTFAPALMLLMDRRASPGLLVRPRPGRIELGGEFVAGDHLAAVSIFAVGSVIVCQRAVAGAGGSVLPPSLSVLLEPAVARYGWYVDRRALGPDLYADGRAAAITTTAGQRLSGQAMLELAWRAARPMLDELAEPAELAIVDDIVAGRLPLPSEAAARPGEPEPGVPTTPPPPYGAALAVRRRSFAEIAPVMLTWEVCVFLLLDRRRGRHAFAAVPGNRLDAFIADLDGGILDRQLAACLRRPPTSSCAASPADVAQPALFDALGPRLALLTPEYGPDGRPAPLSLPTRQAAA